MPDYGRAGAVFLEALEQPPAGRAALLDARCAGDPALRAEVESLLEAETKAGPFMTTPAIVAAGLGGDMEDDPAVGALIGPYRLEQELGRGGMGVVFLAEDTRLGRKVAVKLLAPGVGSDERSRERLRQEARAAAALAHPGIATVYALEDVEERLCLVCEYVRGVTLREEMAAGPLDVSVVADIGEQVARALSAAHAAGIVHRDLKPENVMRSGDGRVRVLDFGIARVERGGTPERRLTEAGDLLGTPGYMSPEQLEGAEVDARSDIFSLGVLLYELATGRNPFDAATPASTAARVIAAEPSSLAEINPCAAPLDATVRRCLRKNREERYQSAADVAQALAEARQHAGSPTRPAASGFPHPRASSSQLPSEVASRPTPRMGESLSVVASGFSRTKLRSWWLFHQAAAMFVTAVMVWPVASVHDTARTDWTLTLLLAVIAAAAVNGTLRAHLLFTAVYNEAQLPAQFVRTRRWLRPSDCLLAALLILAAIPTARDHTVLAAVLAAVAVAWTVTSLVVEPATRRAAYPDAPRVQ